ncbi:MAG TPA: hypothetical protein VGQ42_05990 [Candidatus Dormibacteraeota bacterium]|nr:hypothetical protein [Candidatus Dormibacteraeota bacterium]
MITSLPPAAGLLPRVNVSGTWPLLLVVKAVGEPLTGQTAVVQGPPPGNDWSAVTVDPVGPAVAAVNDRYTVAPLITALPLSLAVTVTATVAPAEGGDTNVPVAAMGLGENASDAIALMAPTCSGPATPAAPLSIRPTPTAAKIERRLIKRVSSIQEVRSERPALFDSHPAPWCFS